MSSPHRTHSRSAGFSLAEALVALAIAGMMAAMLTRFVAGTRTGAARIAERIEMTALGETLLARTVSSQQLRPGRSEGRQGGYAWRMDIAPLPFAVQAVRTGETPSSSRDSYGKSRAGESAGRRGDGSAGFSLGQGIAARPAGGPASAQALGAPPAPSETSAGGIWVPRRVAISIEAPSGQSHAIDTIRLGAADANGR